MKSPLELNERKYLACLDLASLYDEAGKILKSMGLIFEAHLPGARVGSICRIESGGRASLSADSVQAEVVGFREKRALLMTFDDATGVHNDSLVRLDQEVSQALVGEGLLGRVLNARGEPIDGKGDLVRSDSMSSRSLYQKPAHPLEREVIRKPLDLGVRAINGLLTCGRGQRVGIMAGSGVGKSVLLGMICLLYTSPSPRDLSTSRMPSSA